MIDFIPCVASELDIDFMKNSIIKNPYFKDINLMAFQEFFTDFTFGKLLKDRTLYKQNDLASSFFII